MYTIKVYGNYKVIMYDENFVTIDFLDENIGLTIQTFDNLNKALYAFEKTVKTLPEHKALFHKSDIVKMVITE